MKFLCEQCKAKYQIADEKAAGKTVRMKCRKCGHLIEVRAAVTETSVSSARPPQVQSSAPPVAPSAPQRPPPPRARPPHERAAAPKPERTAGALEGAFKSAVQHEEEVSAPFDMSDLSPSDEWYVAINGVPVGPIRVAEIRRKAALGAVSEDSLVWQEGLDEWRPLRSFPELATSVREAMRRLSRPPTAEVRSSRPPPPPSRAPARSIASSASSSRTVPPRAPPSSWPRSNVVPFMSRLATAEKLDESVQERANPVAGQALATPQPARASFVPDPFASSRPALAVPSSGAPVFSTAPPPKKAPPWIPLAMIAAAISFGITTAVVVIPAFVTRPAPSAAPLGVPAPGTPATATATTGAAPPATEIAEPAANQVVTVVKGSAGNAAKAAPSSTAASQGRSLDLHSLTQNAPNIAPVDEPGSEGPKAPGQCISEGQVQQVIGLHQAGIRRACWERNPTVKPTVNVGVAMTIGPDGSAQNVATTGDEPSVSKCIENDLRGWRFPAMGCAQKTSFSFKFVRQ